MLIPIHIRMQRMTEYNRVLWIAIVGLQSFQLKQQTVSQIFYFWKTHPSPPTNFSNR